ncbi:MAG: nicotinate (nicotinamide) nucleotide adenylyltransferase [Oligoflexia bacterium]|nr:nicotinate (nicotinamide) nucleotide adenylyltransferase [Oligoflexia bacterium]
MASIALFGGAFDPPHTGHTLVISALLKSKLCEQVWCVPSADRPDKAWHATAEARLAMLKIALSEAFPGQTSIKIEDAQVNGDLPTSFTIDFLDYIKKQYPQHTFSWVIGADNIPHLQTWKDSARLMRETSFLAYPRPGYDILPTQCPANVRMIEVTNAALSSASSTKIRELIATDQDTSGLLSPGVRSYINEHAIYAYNK